MNHLKYCIFIVTLTISFLANGQNTSTPETLKDQDLENLELINEEKLARGGYSFDPMKASWYDIKRNKMSFQEVGTLIRSGQYGFNLYVNDLKAVQIVQLRKSTPEEKAEIKRQMQALNASKSTDLVGKEATYFELQDLKGNTYNLEALKDKVVVINFWFIGCPPCIKEIPELNELVKEYENKEVVFLGIATDRKRELNKFLTKKNFKYNIIPDGRALAGAYGVMGYPTHIVIDKNSKIAYSATGYGMGSMDQLTAAIEEHLSK